MKIKNRLYAMGRIGSDHLFDAAYNCGASGDVLRTIWRMEDFFTLQSPAESTTQSRVRPSLYKVASDMANLSNLVYFLMELRVLARQNKLSKPEHGTIINRLPLSLGVAYHVIMEEEPKLRGNHDVELNALVRFMKNRGGDTQGAESKLCYVGDFDCGLVYAIGVNPSEKRITVVFRGTANARDILADLKLSKISHPGFPSLSRDSEVDRVGIHRGFYQYLFGEADDNKYNTIKGEIEAVLDQYDPQRQKNYKLYITGHSLGGALATLFGFNYAADTANSSLPLPLPITVVSVGSPRVGNKAFAIKFHQLEGDGKLHHLRITHDKDPVTSQPRWFMHTGMKMKFYDEKHNHKGHAVHVLCCVVGSGLLFATVVVVLGIWFCSNITNRAYHSVVNYSKTWGVVVLALGILGAWFCSKITNRAYHSVMNYSELIESMKSDLSGQKFEDIFGANFKELSLRNLKTHCRVSGRRRVSTWPSWRSSS